MILPYTYTAALLLIIGSLLCWGSWANTFKLTTKWRFELFYFDYALGLFLTAVLAASTLGSLGDDFTFWDNFTTAGKRLTLIAFLAGCVFNLANMLLLAAVSISGLAVVFPIVLNLALVGSALLSHWLFPRFSLPYLSGGIVLVLLGACAAAWAYHEHGKIAGTAMAFKWKTVVISASSGILMGTFYPMLEISRMGENGLGPYGLAFVFAIGVLLSTVAFNLYFINLPVQGKPIPLSWYVRPGNMRNHLLGLAGGAIWCAGAIANFLAAVAPRTVNSGSGFSFVLGQSAGLVAALWGLLVWKEYRGATGRVYTLLALMLLLSLGGLILMSSAPLLRR